VTSFTTCDGRADACPQCIPTIPTNFPCATVEKMLTTAWTPAACSCPDIGTCEGPRLTASGAPVEEVLFGVAVAKLQQRVAGGEAQHVRRHRRAGPQEHDPALVLPQRRVPARSYHMFRDDCTPLLMSMATVMTTSATHRNAVRPRLCVAQPEAGTGMELGLQTRRHIV